MAHDRNDQAGKTLMTLWSEHFTGEQPEKNQAASNYNKYTTTIIKYGYNGQYTDTTADAAQNYRLIRLGVSDIESQERAAFPYKSIKASTPNYPAFFADHERFRTQTEAAYTEKSENTGREFE